MKSATAPNARLGSKAMTMSTAISDRLHLKQMQFESGICWHRSLIAAEPSCQVHQKVDPAVFTYGAVDQPLDLALIGQRSHQSEHTGTCVSQLFGGPPGWASYTNQRSQRCVPVGDLRAICP